METQSSMEIQNSTNDDAMIKVEGGPGKGPRKEVQFPLKARGIWKAKDQKPGSLPAYPWTVHLYTKVTRTGIEVKSGTPAKKLTLAKDQKNVYSVK